MSDIVLALVGETNVNRPNPDTAFLKVQPLFDKADVLFGHMECPVIDHPSDNDDMPDLPYKLGWKFSTPDNLRAWKTAGFDAVGVASNVTGSVPSTLRTIEELDNLAIPHAGIGANFDDARKPAIVTKNGASFAFLSYTSVFYPHFVPALKNRPGAATVKAAMSIVPSWRTEEMPGIMPSVKTWLDPAEKALLLDDIARLRNSVDYIILSCHWGVTDSDTVQDYQIELAHAAIDAGADAIMGHHPHRPQAIEIYNSKPIFYSLGNFAFDWFFVRNFLKEGILAFLSFNSADITKISFAPVRREDASNDIAPLPLHSDYASSIISSIRNLSLPFRTKFELSDHEVIVFT